MKDILAQARRLGEAIGAHARARELAAASADFQADAAAQDLKREYDAALEALRTKADAAARAHEETLRRKVAAHPSIQRLLRAQADFSELMNGVSDEVQRAIGL